MNWTSGSGLDTIEQQRLAYSEGRAKVQRQVVCISGLFYVHKIDETMPSTTLRQKSAIA